MLELSDFENIEITKESSFENILTLNHKPLSYYQTLRKTKTGRTYLTQVGKDFRNRIKESCQEYLKTSCCKIYDRPILLKVIFYHDNKRKNDVDNSFKSLSDSLNEVLYIDDCLIEKLILEKKYDKQKPRIELFIKKC